MHDNVDAWDLQPDGAYLRNQVASTKIGHGAQAALMARYGEQSSGRAR
jgi:polyphosphate kinase